MIAHRGSCVEAAVVPRAGEAFVVAGYHETGLLGVGLRARGRAGANRRERNRPLHGPTKEKSFGDNRVAVRQGNAEHAQSFTAELVNRLSIGSSVGTLQFVPATGTPARATWAIGRISRVLAWSASGAGNESRGA